MFDLIDFVLKLQQIKMRALNNQIVDTFYPSMIETEISKTNIDITANFHSSPIPLETFLHIYKLCEEFEIDKCRVYDQPLKLLLTKKLVEDEENS